MKNYELLLEKVSNWLKPEGKVKHTEQVEIMPSFRLNYNTVLITQHCATFWLFPLLFWMTDRFFTLFSSSSPSIKYCSYSCTSSPTKTYQDITRRVGWLTCFSQAEHFRPILFSSISPRHVFMNIWSHHDCCLVSGFIPVKFNSNAFYISDDAPIFYSIL